MVLENGDTYSGKVVVGADGAYSRVRDRTSCYAGLAGLFKGVLKVLPVSSGEGGNRRPASGVCRVGDIQVRCNAMDQKRSTLLPVQSWQLVCLSGGVYQCHLHSSSQCAGHAHACLEGAGSKDS